VDCGNRDRDVGDSASIGSCGRLTVGRTTAAATTASLPAADELEIDFAAVRPAAVLFKTYLIFARWTAAIAIVM
jgi:hypothetical protein